MKMGSECDAKNKTRKVREGARSHTCAENGWLDAAQPKQCLCQRGEGLACRSGAYI